MSRSTQRFVARLALSALLFLQLAVAAYACNVSLAPGETDVSASVAPNPPCHTTTPNDAKLCEQHCLQASQSVDTQPHSTIAIPGLTPIVAVKADPHLPPARDNYRARFTPLANPPPLVRFGVLRI
jgi:hypothetical protein